MITFQGHNFITQVEDMNVAQFSKSTAIFNEENKTNIEKYLDVMEALGASEEVIDNLTNDELFEIIKDFSRETTVFDKDYVLPRTIEINEKIYESYPEGAEFKIKARDLALIEKAVAKKEDFYQTLLAILFKDSQNKQSVGDKKKLFSTLPAKPYLGYLTEVSTLLTQKIANVFKATQETA
jgi:hypothetical protein